MVLPRLSTVAATFLAALAPTAAAQVHHHADGRPWTNRASSGPDAECDGWFYNLGVTGVRVKLVDAAPTELVVGCVLKDSPARGLVE